MPAGSRIFLGLMVHHPEHGLLFCHSCKSVVPLRALGCQHDGGGEYFPCAMPDPPVFDDDSGEVCS